MRTAFTIVGFLLGFAVFSAALQGCSVDQDKARRALEAQGITQVQFGGWSLFGCGKREASKKWSGVGANGKPIHGIVCQGLLKGLTIRFD